MQKNSNHQVHLDRQIIADRPLYKKSTYLQICKTWITYRIRKIVFAISPLRRVLEKKRMEPEENRQHWDSLMSQSQFSTYLGATINVDGANAITSILLKFYANERPSILDIGCSGGTLVTAISSFSTYVGLDVSTYAIQSACKLVTDRLPDRLSDISFQAADLRVFQPTLSFDVMVFNEVLYYLKTDQAVEEVCRYAKHLNKDGLIIVSMKDDGKSNAIFKLLLEKFNWVDGVLWQRKATVFDFKIRPNRERPAFMVGALRS